MAGRRLGYLAVALGCGVFYIVYGEWAAFMILIWVLVLPWLSLLVSLPAIFRFRAVPSGPDALTLGTDGELWLLGTCPMPMPPFRGQLKLRRLLTGQQWRYREGKGLLSDHCGGIAVTIEKLRVCDYLGLFAFPVRRREPKVILIRPKPLAMTPPKDLHRRIAQAWRPKFGGGYGENHELRLYRPGDGLNQIHWKLTAKTGKLMFRQSMEPQPGRFLLTMHLRGTPEELDRKFGRLLWLGEYLLDQSLSYEIRCLTGEGVLTFPVFGQEQLQKAIDTLLCTPLAGEGDLRQQEYRAAWQHHIGGDADEG